MSISQSIGARNLARSALDVTKEASIVVLVKHVAACIETLERAGPVFL